MRLKLSVLIFCLLLSACNLPAPATNTPLPPTATATSLPPTATETPLPPTLTPTTPAPSMPVLIDVALDEVLPAPTAYELHIHYPRLDPASVANTNPFDADVQGLVMDVVNQMRADFIANAATIPSDMSGWASYLEVSYDLTQISPTYISLRFTFDFYVAGAAHPNLYYLAYNFDLAENRALAIWDTFQPGSDYLNLIANHCTAELTARLGADVFFAGGATAELVNYKTWNLTPTGYLVTFDPYQVAPYAAGPQEVLIPYASLGGFFLPKYLP